jgi:hypothetical protein
MLPATRLVVVLARLLVAHLPVGRPALHLVVEGNLA